MNCTTWYVSYLGIQPSSSGLSKSENIYGRIKMLFFISIPRPTFSAQRESTSSGVVYVEKRVISACTCACRARVSSRSATNMSSTCMRGERRGEQREKNGEGERWRGSEKTRYLKLHGSVYYLLSAISASTEKVHPTGDRRMICAPGALESARSINGGGTHRVRSAEDRNLNFLLDRGSIVALLPLFIFSISSRRNAENTSRTTTRRNDNNDGSVKRNALSDAVLSGNEDAIIKASEMRRLVRMAFHLANAMTPYTPQDLYASWHFQIFNYRDARYYTESPPQKRNKSLARSLNAIYCVHAYKSARTRVHVLSSHIALYAHRYSSRAKGSILECWTNAPISRQYQIGIQNSNRIELASMKALKRRGSCCSN